MTTLIDIILPIFTLIVAALLTIPIFKAIRKSNHKTGLSIAWFMVVFAVASLTVANLALSYYSTTYPATLNLTLDGTANAAIASSFLIDAVSSICA